MAEAEARRKKGSKPGKGKPAPGFPAPVQRAVIETGFIVFLFYSNLLMGEFTRSNGTPGKSLLAALVDIFTAANFAIALVTALIGYLVFEYFRKIL
ncbi:MAG TPA: hypothetical protein VK842_02825 [bacterium]|jgi:hypothetical protein|nr:hypothetical protein [bacterium]